MSDICLLILSEWISSSNLMTKDLKKADDKLSYQKPFIQRQYNFQMEVVLLLKHTCNMTSAPPHTKSKLRKIILGLIVPFLVLIVTGTISF